MCDARSLRRLLRRFTVVLPMPPPFFPRPRSSAGSSSGSSSSASSPLTADAPHPLATAALLPLALPVASCQRADLPGQRRRSGAICKTLRLVLRVLLLTLLLGLLVLALFNRAHMGALILGIAPGSFSVAPPPEDTVLPDVVTMATMVRNEGRYLREWVSHHHRLGVSHFIVFDDTLPTEPYPAAPVLEDYIRRGVVEVVSATPCDDHVFFLSSSWSMKQPNVPFGDMPLWWQMLFHSKQQRALVAAWHMMLGRARSDCHQWLALLDVDEYYNPKAGPLLQQLRGLRLRGARTLHLAKLDFGTSGIEHRPADNSVRPHYIWRNGYVNRFSSVSLVRSITGMAPYCVHNFHVNSLISEVWHGMYECNHWPENDPTVEGRLQRGVYHPRLDELVVHHYVTKSVEECLERQAVISVALYRVKDRRCQTTAYMDVCDDSMLDLLQQMEEEDGAAHASAAAAAPAVTGSSGHARVTVPDTVPARHTARSILEGAVTAQRQRHQHSSSGALATNEGDVSRDPSSVAVTAEGGRTTGRRARGCKAFMTKSFSGGGGNPVQA